MLNIYTAGKQLSLETPSVIFIHGQGADHSMWVPYCRYFARMGYNALAIDLPGRTGSPLLTKQTFADFAEIIQTELIGRKIGKSLFVGHGLGAALSAYIAERMDSVAGVVSLGLISLNHPHDKFIGRIDSEVSMSEVLEDLAHIGQEPLLEGNPSAGIAWLMARKRLLERLPLDTVRNDLYAAIEAQIYFETMSPPRIPLCTIAGASDYASPLPALERAISHTAQEWRIALDCPGASLMMEAGNNVLNVIARFCAASLGAENRRCN